MLPLVQDEGVPVSVAALGRVCHGFGGGHDDEGAPGGVGDVHANHGGVQQEGDEAAVLGGYEMNARVLGNRQVV